MWTEGGPASSWEGLGRGQARLDPTLGFPLACLLGAWYDGMCEALGGGSVGEMSGQEQLF